MEAMAEVKTHYIIGGSKRRAAFQKRIFLFSALTLCLVSLGVLFGSGFSDAAKSNAANSHTAYKYYTSIQVKAGDSLWSIAKEYYSPEYYNLQEYMEEVAVLNGLSEMTIHTGEYLTVPYYSFDYK